MDSGDIPPVLDGPGLPPAGADAPAPPAPVPARGRRFGRRARIATLSVAVVAALTAGAAIWAPWTPSPPTAVHATSPTATTAVISWTASMGGFGPSHYLVLRDGKQIGLVPASVTSYTDHGLVPGMTYHYTVIAAGMVNSGPSAKATVRAATPSPAGLVTSQVTHTTVTLRWSPPPNAPTPDHYVIYNEPNVVTTVPGTTTSYTDKAETPAAQFQYDVVAQWGSASSAPSAAVSGQTLAPPLPQSSVPVHVDYASVPGNGWTGEPVGFGWTDQLSAEPACTAGSCDLTITLSLIPPGGYGYKQIPVAMHPSGSGGAYTGSAKAQVTYCGAPPKTTPETDTFTLTMTPARGSVRNGEWGAWSGTVVLHAPPLTVAAGSCPAGTWTLALRS